MTKWHRDLLRRLRDAGVTVTDIHHRQNSIALDCVMGTEQVRYFTGISPSDVRAMDNAFHDIMRVLRKPETSNA